MLVSLLLLNTTASFSEIKTTAGKGKIFHLQKHIVNNQLGIS